MDLPVDHPAFRVRRLVVRTASFLKGMRLLVDGSVVDGKRLTFRVCDDTGTDRSIVLKQTFFLDPIPTVQVDAEPPLALARPLHWYEWAWMALPLVLVFAGGGFGVLFGLSAVWANTRIFRSDRGNVAKYLLAGFVSAFATFSFVVAVTIVQIALRK